MFSSAIKSFTSNLISNYSIASQPSSYSGPWKIFDAKKKGSGKAVSVFVFDRKTLEPQGVFGRQGSASSLRRAQDEVIERLKKEASALARLRHPSILELAEPVEETKSGGLMFATEPITASLGTVLGDRSRRGDSGGRYVSEETEDGGRRRKEFELDELEIQKGLLQVGKGLEFLHESAHLVHANLTPEAIFINAKSDWKLSGLGFSSPPDDATGASSVAPISLGEVLNYDARLPRFVQLNLDYTSPDFVIDTNLTSSADMFSLGLVVIALYNSPHQSPLETSQSVSTFKRIFSTPSSIPTINNSFHCSAKLPDAIKTDLLPKLITRRPAQRYGAREFQQARYFDNVLVSTMRFLDSLPAKTAAEKSQFMRGLPRILSQFPKSVIEKKILPALLEETKDLDLLTLVLQNSFKCVELVADGNRAMSDFVVPKLRSVFLAPTKGQQSDRTTLKEGGLVVVLDDISLIAKNCSSRRFKEDILPVIFSGLESQTHSLVDHSLQTLPIIVPVLDFSTVRNDLFPVVANVFAKTSSMAIKIQGLHALNVLCGGTSGPEPDVGDGLDGMKTQPKAASNTAILDKYTVQEKVVPLLKAIKTKEPAVMMAALSVFRQVGKVADTDFLALDVLPCLWSFSLGPLLNLEQFQGYMKLIKALGSKIETEQTRKLSELSSTSSATRSFTQSLGGQSSTNGIHIGDVASNGETDFESLVTGRTRGAQSNDLFDTGWGADTAGTASVPRVNTVQQPPSSRSLSNGLGAPLVSGRSGTITPDNLGSFTSMITQQPANASSSNPLGQTLQPQRSYSSSFQTYSTTPSQPLQHQPTTIAASTGSSKTRIDWSRASTTSKFLPPTASSTNSGNAYSSFSIAPPPMSPSGPMNVQMPTRPTTNSSIQQNNTKPTEKQGIDKYESLI